MKITSCDSALSTGGPSKIYIYIHCFGLFSWQSLMLPCAMGMVSWKSGRKVLTQALRSRPYWRQQRVAVKRSIVATNDCELPVEATRRDQIQMQYAALRFYLGLTEFPTAN